MKRYYFNGEMGYKLAILTEFYKKSYICPSMFMKDL